MGISVTVDALGDYKAMVTPMRATPVHCPRSLGDAKETAVGVTGISQHTDRQTDKVGPIHIRRQTTTQRPSNRQSRLGESNDSNDSKINIYVIYLVLLLTLTEKQNICGLYFAEYIENS